jgi:hypothetical protein
LIVALGLTVALPSAASGPFDEPLELDASIPSAETFLGYPIGKEFTPHHRIVAYLETLANASDCVEIERYGTTYEGRPLILLIVSDPSNLSRREELQEAYARLADPRQLSEAQAKELCRDLPVATWLSFNIHGDEASSSEASMALAYRLAADQDPDIRRLLESSVVIIDPCLNPDGRDRYVNWLTGVMGMNPDPLEAAREHHQPWPGGRYNHYLFDLNRDWAWLVQRESRARTRAYLSWRPQVHVDFHEMWAASTYFFFPPERPIHALFPASVAEWGRIFGRGNADAFDARGWRYYTGESFDLYYPGYGDSWPTFHGAIGMTYEQAGHGFAGTALRRAAGDTLTLAQRAEHHYTSALATARTAVEHREARLLDFRRFFEPGDGSGPSAYLFPPGDDPPRTAELVGLLMSHGAEVYRAAEPIRPRELRTYDNEPVSQSLPEGTYVVRMDQPLHRFLRAILEPEAALPDTFFYDVSAWSLPLAFGIEAYWSEGNVGGKLDRLVMVPRVRGRLVNPEAKYAYVISWKRNNAARAAAWLQGKKVKIHFATREFSAGDERFPPGSLVLFRSGNVGQLPDLVRRVAETTGVDVIGVDSGLTDAGPDLGSRRIQPLKTPRVAVVVGSSTSPTSAGACWFLLDRLYGVPHSLVSADNITRSALEDYSVLVFPDDGAGGKRYASSLDSSAVEAVREWVEDGGVYVGLGGGAFYAASDGAGLSTVRQAPRPDGDPDLSEEEKKAQERARRQETQSERERRRRLEQVPGTIFRVQVDPLHPLGFGYTDHARVLKISDRALELGPPGTNVAWFTPLPKVSGYASPDAVDHLEDSPFLVDERRGRGHVVLYVEDPNFRLFWYGLTKLFLNSLYFLPSMSGR